MEKKDEEMEKSKLCTKIRIDVAIKQINRQALNHHVKSLHDVENAIKDAARQGIQTPPEIH